MMTTSIKKALVLLLCAAVLLGTCSLFSYADTAPENTDLVSGLSNASGDKVSGLLSSASAEGQKYASDTVAVFYLCSNWTGLPSLGHIWTYIENVSEKPLKIGTYYLLGGEGVSVGKFALTRSDGAGIYYNVESYTAALYGMEDCLYIKTEMTLKDVEKLSERILYSNFWDPAVFNCASFAISSWNMVSDRYMFPFVVLPFVARFQLRAYGAQTDLKMYAPDRHSVYKQINFGDDATMRPVSDGTVDTPPG